MWSTTLWLLKSISIGSILIVQGLTFAQSDTVIIEKIRVQKHEIIIHEVDTLVRVDTVVKVEKDTVFVEKKKKQAAFENTNFFYIGTSLGVSHDMHHTQYWQSHQNYYTLTQNAISSKLNQHFTLNFGLHRNNFFIAMDAGFTKLRDQFTSIEIDHTNNINYLKTRIKTGVNILNLRSLKLTGWIGNGCHILLNNSGYYFNPENPVYPEYNNSYLSLNKFIYNIGIGTSTFIALRNNWMLSTSISSEYWANSITTKNHPVQYWKTNFYGELGISKVF